MESVICKLNACRRNIIQWLKDQNIKHDLLITHTQQDLEKALSDGTPNAILIDSLTNTLRNANKEEQFFFGLNEVGSLKEWRPEHMVFPCHHSSTENDQ